MLTHLAFSLHLSPEPPVLTPRQVMKSILSTPLMLQRPQEISLPSYRYCAFERPTAMVCRRVDRGATGSAAPGWSCDPQRALLPFCAAVLEGLLGASTVGTPCRRQPNPLKGTGSANVDIQDESAFLLGCAQNFVSGQIIASSPARAQPSWAPRPVCFCMQSRCSLSQSARKSQDVAPFC